MRSISDISVVINARVESTRVKHKLIREFNNTNLLSIALDKVSLISIPANKYLATCEKEIIDIYSKGKYNNIKILNRSSESSKKGNRDQRITFAHYKNIPTRYIMSINACFPFTKKETYENIINEFIKHEEWKTLTSVKKKNNLFFDSEFKLINPSNSIRTQDNLPVYEMAHVFHIFDRVQFLETGSFWDYSENNPAFYVMKEDEQLLDIDNEREFNICEELYKSGIFLEKLNYSI